MENIDYYRIEKAIKYIEANYKNQPTLDEIADHICLSPFHFQRLFKDWAGVTPKRFIQFLTLEYAKKVLSEGHSIFDATFRSGLSGPSRLHDLFVNIEGVTPGEFKNHGKGLNIYYGFYQSPFGPYMLAVTERGICALHFTGDHQNEKYLDQLKSRWPEADLTQDSSVTGNYHKHLFTPNSDRTKITLLLKGTNFQLKVWKALLQIPSGCLTSYDTIARKIENLGASRAVGSAIGSNPVGFIIPCHRVINKIGVVGNYRWGSAKKRAIIGWEASQLLQQQPEDVGQKMPA